MDVADDDEFQWILLWGILLVVWDADADDDDDDDDDNDDAADDDSINFTLVNPPGHRPPPPPNASLGDLPSLNPPETFCEWM